MRLLFPILAGLVARQHVFAKPVEVESDHLFVHKKIEMKIPSDTVCGIDCEKNCVDEHGMKRELGGCFNVGMFFSQEAVKDEDKELAATMGGPPLISASVSTIGAPSVVVGFCASGPECVSSPMMPMSTTSNFWLSVINNHLLHQTKSNRAESPELHLLSFGPSYRLGETLFSLGAHLQEIVEFEDINHDGKYTIGTDKILQQVQLGDATYLPMKKARIPVKDEKYDAHTLSVGTVDKKIGLTCEMSSKVDKLSTPERTNSSSHADERLRSPNAVRCVLRIKDFVFIGNRSQLAIQIVLINPNGWAEGKFRSEAKGDGTTVVLINKQSVGRRGYFSWTPTAITKSGSGPFEGGGSRESSVRMSKFQAVAVNSIAYSLAKSQAVLSDNTVAYTAYASISGSSYNPSEVVWDFSVGYGVPPIETNTGHNVATFLVFFFGIATLALVLCVASNSALSSRLALPFGGGDGADLILGYSGGAADGSLLPSASKGTGKSKAKAEHPTVLTYGQSLHLQGVDGDSVQGSPAPFDT